jgi:RNA polymerase sigma-70 factor (ECF subfamily)
LSGGDTALADDLAQESLLVAWRQLPQFRGEARFATWLYRIGYHQYLMHRRQDTPAATTRSLDALPVEESIDPLTQEHRDLTRDLQVALDELTAPERVAIVHCYFLDLSHDEAAQVLDIPLGTLKSHVQRGKEKLRHRMAAWQGESSL